MDYQEKIQELEKELRLCRNKVRELEGTKRALEQEVALLNKQLIEKQL